MGTVLTQNLSISLSSFGTMVRTFALLVCLLPLSVSAGEVDDKSFTFVCLSDNGFNMNFRVDTAKRTILWASSQSSKSKNDASISHNGRWEQHSNQQIIFWEYPVVFVYDRDRNNSSIPTTRYFDFDKNIMYQSINVNALGQGRLNTQSLWQCVKS